jgi:ubiquitin-protein ligase
MYEDGKCCATILNTWGDNKYEKWTSSMNIESIIISFMSFFDNDPYSHEPGGTGDDSYTIYVLHQSWSSCLLRYLDHEEDNLFQEYLQKYLIQNYSEILYYLEILHSAYGIDFYYTRCFEISWYNINYLRIINKVRRLYSRLTQENQEDNEENQEEYQENQEDQEEYVENNEYQEYQEDTENQENHEDIGNTSNTENVSDLVNTVGSSKMCVETEKSLRCCICMDTKKLYDPIYFVKFHCNHEFHRVCMKTHESICPMCRKELTENDLGLLNFKWKRKNTSSTQQSKKRIRLE